MIIPLPLENQLKVEKILTNIRKTVDTVNDIPRIVGAFPYNPERKRKTVKKVEKAN